MTAVSDVLFVVSVLREYGITVTFEPDWENRGNGQWTDFYDGSVIHHTGTPGVSYENPGPTARLLRDGRSDLSGPLCNGQGRFDGSVHIIAAFPANHAGASGGPSMGPLPVTRLFNPRVMGWEMDYAGNSPMSPEQYRTALVIAEATRRLRSRSSMEWTRAHAETSIEGKWDPGYAPGQTINMGVFRADALNIQEGDLSAAAEEQIRQIHASLSKMWTQRGTDIGDAFVSMFDSLKPVAVETGPKGADGKAPTILVRPNEAAANVYGQTFYGSNYGAGPAIVRQLAEATGITIDFDEEELAQSINGTVSAVVLQAVVEIAIPAIREVIGEDNEDQAQAVVDLIHKKLGGAA